MPRYAQTSPKARDFMERWLISIVKTASVRRLRHSQTMYLLKYFTAIDRLRLNTAHGSGTGLRKCAENGDLSYLRIRDTSICVSYQHTINRYGKPRNFGQFSLSAFGSPITL